MMPSCTRMLHRGALLFAFLAAFLSLAPRFAVMKELSKKPSYLELSHINFMETVNSHDALLVMFKVTWCGHCKKALESMEIAGTKLAGMENLTTKINFATVDCTTDPQDKEICDQNYAKAYPKFVLFESGVPLAQDDLDRDPEKLLEFILKFNGNAIKPMTGDTLTRLINYKENSPMVVAYFKDQSSQEYKELEKTAKKMRAKLSFGMTMDPSVLKMTPGSAYAFAVFRKMEEPSLYSGTWETDAMEKFIDDESVPLVGEIDSDLFQKYTSSNKTIFYFFYGAEKEQLEFMPILKKMATMYRNTINVGFINASKFGSHATQMGLREQWPAIALADKTGSKKWMYDQNAAITGNGIELFLQKFAKNQLKQYIKSEPVPAASSNLVRTVVGSTFDDVVFRPNQDVLVFFHALWCGHCKNFAPTFAAVAEKLAHISDSIVLAKIDADRNDIPESAGVKIAGFPTIVLYHGVMKKPIVHYGGRSLTEIIAFLKEKAHHSEKITTDGSAPSNTGILDNEEL